MLWIETPSPISQPVCFTVDLLRKSQRTEKSQGNKERREQGREGKERKRKKEREEFLSSPRSFRPAGLLPLCHIPHEQWPPPGSQPSAVLGLCVGRIQSIFFQRLETITFISQKVLGDNLGCIEGTQVSSLQKHHQKGVEERNPWVCDVPISLLTGTHTTGDTSGRIECWGRPAINQLCLY